MNDLELEIGARKNDIRDLVERSTIENAGCYQAIDQLKEALDDLRTALGEMDYKQVSKIGYKGVSSGFVFLQRTLGLLNSVEMSISELIQDIALKTNRAYEDIEPVVMQLLKREKNRPTDKGDSVEELVSQGLKDIEAGRVYPVDTLWDGIDSAKRNKVVYQNLIEVVPGKRGGRPCIKKTRIAVSDVLNWFALGMSPKEIIADYPELNQEQLMACLQYAARNISKN